MTQAQLSLITLTILIALGVAEAAYDWNRHFWSRYRGRAFRWRLAALAGFTAAWAWFVWRLFLR